MKHAYHSFVGLGLLAASLITFAADSSSTGSGAGGPQGGAGGPPPNGRPPGPPPEAIAACVGKTAGTTVTFKGRGGESFTGVCELDNGTLAARPSGGAQKR